MTDGRRVVRAVPQFFDAIDRGLPDSDRSAFLADHLFVIVDRFAERFDELPLVPGEDRCRMLIGAYEDLGYVVAGLLQLDDSIELYGFEADLDPPWAHGDGTED